MTDERDDKIWYKSLYEKMRPFQFNWIGRTNEGVSRWIGAPKGPSERICKIMMRYGLVMSAAGLLATAGIMLRLEGGAPLGLLALIGVLHGVIFSILGFWLGRMRKNLERLKSVQELAADYDATPETVQRLAEVHGIRARININGDNLYDPDEFIASRSLLRASSSPNTSETLLRAAQPRVSPITSESLLRPSEPECEGLTPVQQLFLTPDEKTEETPETVQTLWQR